jgi:hypothetical protein
MLRPFPANPLEPDFDLVVNPCSGSVQVLFNNEYGCGTAEFTFPGATNFNVSPYEELPGCWGGYILSGSANYQISGSYQISLSLTRSDGSVSIKTKSFSVISSALLLNMVTILPGNTFGFGQNLTIQTASFDNAIYNWFLDYGSGFQQTQSGSSNFLLFTSSQTINLIGVRLELVVCGVTKSVTLSINVILPPQVSLTAPSELCEGTGDFLISATQIPGATYTWFLDGDQEPYLQASSTSQLAFESGLGPNFPLNFLDRAIEVLVVNQGCSTQVSKTVRIHNQFFDSPFQIETKIGNGNFTVVANDPFSLQVLNCQSLYMRGTFPTAIPPIPHPIHFLIEELFTIGNPIVMYSGTDPVLQGLSEGLHQYRITPFSPDNPCQGPSRNFTVDVLAAPKMDLQSICQPDGKFQIQALLPTGASANENFTFWQNSQILQDGTSSLLTIFVPSAPPVAFDGEGFKVSYGTGSSTCFQSEAFQILGKPDANGNPPLYSFLEVEKLAFVHSNIRLTYACQIKPGARVYNRGQWDNPNFDGSNDPWVNEVKWTVDGKVGTSLSLGENALITSGCDRMWQGIEMLGSQADPIHFYMQPGAKISHAFKALKLPLQNGKTVIEANEGNFENNFIGVEIEQDDLSNSHLEDCQFTSSALLAPFIGTVSNPITSRFGINLVKGIGSTSTSTLLVKNCQINNHLIGINAYGGRFRAEKCTLNAIRYKGMSIDNAPY